MTGRKIVLAVVSVFMLLSLSQVANATAPFPYPNPTPDALEGYCNEHGGLYSPPNASGVYWCLLPDGTLIACGGSIPFCTQTRTLEDKGLGLSEEQTQKLKALAADYEKSRIRGEADLGLAEVDVQALVHDDKSDMVAIENALKKSEAAHTAMRLKGIKTLRAASAVLTPEQREKWRSRMAMRLGAKGEEGYVPGAHEGAREPAKKPTP